MLEPSQPNATKFGKMMVNRRLLVLWFSLFLYLCWLLCCLIVFFACGSFTDFSSLAILFTDVNSRGPDPICTSFFSRLFLCQEVRGWASIMFFGVWALKCFTAQ